MGIYATPYVNVAVSTGIYIAAEALGVLSSVRLPEHCLLTSVVVIDRDNENDELDIVMYGRSPAGTADNAAYDPSDAELEESLGSVTVSTYKAFANNSMASVDNIGKGLWLPEGVLYLQCVTRATPTFTATTDLRIRFVVVT